MRIDLEHTGRRPWYFKLALALVGTIVGVKPGPMLSVTYRADLFPSALRGYILRGTAGAGSWSKGEVELLSAFVSNLNACHF